MTDYLEALEKYGANNKPTPQTETAEFKYKLDNDNAELWLITVPFQTVAIERYTRLASYCGVESRQPFFDKRVVELCLSLPWQQKAQNGYLKHCLRNVLERVAPCEVAWRTEFDSGPRRICSIGGLQHRISEYEVRGLFGVVQQRTLER